MASFDWNRNKKRCSTSTSRSLLRPCCVDRLTCLPNELLTGILSMLPTKDAAATQILSNSLRLAFCWTTSVDLDDSLISHCVKHPHLVERFSLFESFVDNVLHKLSQSQQSLTRFRLHLGGDKTILARTYYNGHRCKKACFPDPQRSRLYAWISYPLAHCGLRELDLSFHVRNPSEYKLPPGLFVRQSLEVLRLGCNLEMNNDTDIPVICLPNLKLLHLHSFEFADDDFVTRLVSNCPALEDLSIAYCWWLKFDHVIISSHSIRRFVLIILNYVDELKSCDLMLIDAPNLQYFRYTGNLPFNLSIAHLNALVEAFIYVDYPLLQLDTLLPSSQIQLSLARALSNVQHLSLYGIFPEIFFYAAELKDQLPVFHSLRILKLGSLFNKFCSARWDIVLLLILHCSPLLETLIFPEGLFTHAYTKRVSDSPEDLEAAALESDGWTTTQTIPSCCKSHLKQIVISYCCGCDQELNMIKFLLGNTSVLKEFTICLPKNRIPCDGVRSEAPNFDQYENTLEELPRASNSCSIIYCSEPLYASSTL